MAVLVCFGCTGQPSAGPDDAVNAFFGEVSAGRCPDASKWLDGEAKRRFEEEGCEVAIEKLRSKQFERVLSSTVDGRDDERHLVRVRFAAERETVIIGVRKTARGHRIVSF